jgi:hypothetical protein
VKLTVPDEIEHPVEELLRVFTTVSPDVAVAPGEYEPPALPELGGVLVVIVLAE